MKRWIPKVGEKVTIDGTKRGLPTWTGFVESVSKYNEPAGQVYLRIAHLGHTCAAKDEITIHS
jgi:hypothetical protein